MQPVRSHLLKCPKCSKLFYTGSLQSMNSYGSMLYSDCLEIVPWLWETPSIIKCNNCDKFFWSDDAEITDKDHEEDKIKQYWKDAEPVQFLTLEELFKSLKSDAIRNEKDEYFVRRRIWWAYNDRVREGTELFIDKADENHYRENILQIIQLMNLDVFKFQLITVAEMSRNIGDFESCLSILDSIQDKSLYWAKKRLKELCNKRKKLVCICGW